GIDGEPATFHPRAVQSQLVEGLIVSPVEFELQLRLADARGLRIAVSEVLHVERAAERGGVSLPAELNRSGAAAAKGVAPLRIGLQLERAAEAIQIRDGLAVPSDRTVAVGRRLDH